MSRAKNGEAISAGRKTRPARRELQRFIEKCDKKGIHDEWKRGKAVMRYIAGERVELIAKEYDVVRGSVNRWLQWYEADGVAGLRTGKPTGVPPKLNDAQRQKLIGWVEGGPLAAGYQSGVWTGPMIGDMIEKQFGVRYHKHHVPRLLHELGFSLQRPRKRLAKADLKAQETWVRTRLPAIKKKRGHVAEL